MADTPERHADGEGRGSNAEQMRDAEHRQLDHRMHMRAPVVFEVLRHEGWSEMERPLGSLWWSGLVAGFSICFSVLGEAALKASLPDAEWATLIASFGYTIGFVIVIIGQQQLFTEATITAVIPVLGERTMRALNCMLRLWAVVFIANVVGTAIFMANLTLLPVLPDPIHAEVLKVSEHALAPSAMKTMISAVGAGFLIAAIVWISPSAEGGEFWIIVMLTYAIAIMDFAHVIAGSAEAWLLIFTGHTGVIDGVFGYILPALVGNVIGGSALFALLSYGQVKQEVDNGNDDSAG